MARFTLLSLASPAAEISSCPTVSCGSFPVHTGSTSEFRTVFLMSLLLIGTLLLLFSLVLGQESKCAADRFPRPPGHRGFSVPLGLPERLTGLACPPAHDPLLCCLRSGLGFSHGGVSTSRASSLPQAWHCLCGFLPAFLSFPLEGLYGSFLFAFLSPPKGGRLAG